MSFQLNIPPSVVSKLAKSEDGDNEPQKKGREDYKKMKELEEARKAGTVPAMQDEEGKDINPHIPQYIMQAPWYFGSTVPTLRHQRPQAEKERKFAAMDQWYKKGVKEGPVATKFRKGACENCGAMTHKKKDCLERPRKIGAKFTGDGIAPDEYIHSELSHDYDGKRDRWNGFDVDDYSRVYEEYQKVEEAKRQLKAQRLDQALISGETEVIESVKDADDEDEDKYADDVDMPGQKFETKQRITVRNLRIREDTAKYLHNLDPNSAYYDPKTRSMRENPFKGTSKEAQEHLFAGDNFVRYSGDATNMAKNQMFAWDAYERGADVHLQANPTQLELLHKEFDKKKDEFKSDVNDSILDKYGGKEHLEAPPKQMLLAQTEEYVEYSRHGTVIKGREKAIVRSIWEEDVYINNHTSVWGSFWKEGRWGFKCCYSFIKESYCTGEAGKLAAESSMPALTHGDADLEEEEEKQPKSLVEQHQERLEEERRKKKNKKKKDKKKKKKAHKKKRDSSSSSDSDESVDEEEEREKKIKEAIKKEEARQKEVERLMAIPERKRPYNSAFMNDTAEPTEEEMEAYRRKRKNFEDPMSAFT
ncbi:pre-mRNA-splicing factor SLU7 [Lingula anatina]|uniref:Pre-mRNA-splicing factor SLU7 n=1 Tax=Lingula anatina TaxID=7574 RepID=A0A1S3KD03_LINAN|nr:pre-mRNA-splicing factor SLU7 [Lingula anatina]|eukprot:XP_013420500.1 pre-mRNA-splicing factor SLU7 [Lingula anatina]